MDRAGDSPNLPRTGLVSDERLARYHEYTRKHGVNWILYLLARIFMTPFCLVYFRYRREGKEHGKLKGGLIVASNHRSFFDPFLIGGILPWRRPMNYVAKVELFRNPVQAWWISRLGAFPIRRGESDEDSVTTARMVVERGGTVCIFPEGTRIRSGSLADPKRGVGRLALETGAPVLPTAVIGTEHVRRGWKIRPRRVRVRLGRAIGFPRATEPSQALAEKVTQRIWPNVLLQWEAMGGLPPMRRAAVIGAGSWGTAVAVLLARGGLEVQLGTRTAVQALSSPRSATTSATSRTSSCPTRSTSGRPRRSSSPASTSSASRFPPARCRRRSARSPTRSATAPRCCS